MRLIEDFKSINGKEHFSSTGPVYDVVTCTTEPVNLKQYCNYTKADAKEGDPTESVLDILPTVASNPGDCNPDSDNNVFSQTSYKDMREQYIDAFTKEFNDIVSSGDTANIKINKYKCLLGGLAESINQNMCSVNKSDDKLKDYYKELEDDKAKLKEYENRIESNEDTGLVGEYRNENTEKITKKLNTYFTLYVTFIVVFLIVEGILFFV